MIVRSIVRGWDEHVDHRSASKVRYAIGERDTRPWGTWEVLATGDRYTVKRINVLPGERLSLQYHRHRSEHWTIVAGFWNAPHRVDTGQAARLTIRRACSCSNLAGLRYLSAECSRLLL
jgi:hypothetical protein